MAVFNIIRLSELEEAKRIDAENYHPEKIEAEHVLNKVSCGKLKDYFFNVREIFDPKKHMLRNPSMVFGLSGIQYYFLTEGSRVAVAKEVGSAKKIFQKGDVLISRLRPYLKEITYIGFNGDIKLGTTEFVVLRQKIKDYSPQVLFALLTTDYVQKILFWNITGTEHPRFSEEYFLNLPLPKFNSHFQEEIKKRIDKACELFLQSKSLYSQAESLLLEELGLTYFKPKYKL